MSIIVCKVGGGGSNSTSSVWSVLQFNIQINASPGNILKFRCIDKVVKQAIFFKLPKLPEGSRDLLGQKMLWDCFLHGICEPESKQNAS